MSNVPGPGEGLGDLPPEEMRGLLHQVADWAADYRETIEQRPIVPPVLPGEATAGIPVRLPDVPERMDAIMRDLDTVILPGVVHWGHPSFLGYFGSTSNGPALIGEIAAAALNVSAMTWKTSPVATELETIVLGWIRSLVGLPEQFMGVVYDTASIATLHALAAAREMAGTDVRALGVAARSDVSRMRIYTSDQAHSSIAKAMIVLGLGESNCVRIPSDGEFRMDADKLEAQLAEDMARGDTPVAVVATVGSTSTASVDPVSRIADLCERHGIWLHVDAAYGGALAVLPEGRWAIDGVERADSVVINPHKWLFVPLDFSTLFVRRPEVLRSVFALTPEYLRGDADAESGAIDYMDYSIQLGRRFRALKAWMTFRAFGANGIRSRVREHCRLAALLESWVIAEPGVRMAAPRRMGVVCFRFEPDGLSDRECDQLNERMVEQVNASGEAYLTHTELRGRTCVRVGLGNVLTTEMHLRKAWNRILQARPTTVP